MKNREEKVSVATAKNASSSDVLAETNHERHENHEQKDA